MMYKNYVWEKWRMAWEEEQLELTRKAYDWEFPHDKNPEGWIMGEFENLTEVEGYLREENYAKLGRPRKDLINPDKLGLLIEILEEKEEDKQWKLRHEDRFNGPYKMMY